MPMPPFKGWPLFPTRVGGRTQRDPGTTEVSFSRATRPIYLAQRRYVDPTTRSARCITGFYDSNRISGTL